MGLLSEFPQAQDDAFRTDEDAIVSGNLFADNGSGPDIGPGGTDPVVVAIDGRTIAIGETVLLPLGALLTVAADGTFTYDPNHAFDILPIGASATDTFTYTILGQATAPAFPAQIDLAALDGTNGYRISFGATVGSIAGAGDVNGDGYDDLVAGIVRPGAFEFTRVIYGAADGFGGAVDATAALPADRGFDIVAIDDPHEPFGVGGLGASVDAVGDYNGDGIDDILVGAPTSENVFYGRYFQYAGAAFIVYGKVDRDGPVDVNSSTDVVLLNTSHDDASTAGNPLAGAGDVNGDGFADVIVSDLDRYYGGKVVVAFGPSGGLLSARDGTNGFIFDTDSYGASVSSAGDLNGDGLSDVIIGTPGSRAYVVFGSTAPFPAVLTAADLDGTRGVTFTAAGNGTVTSVSTVGDVNGDGIDDVAVGLSGAAAGAGRVYVVFGSRGGFDASLDLATLSGAAGFVVEDGAPAEKIGGSVSEAGDFNDDGLADFVVSAAGTGGQPGSAYVVFGSASGFPSHLDLASLDGSNGLKITGADVDLVTAVGDVDGDGAGDLIVKSGTDAFVLFGGTAHFAGSSATVTVTIDGTGAAPSAVDDTYALDEDTPLAVPAATGVLTNDVDSAGDVLTASLISGPEHAASFALQADGSFVYTPTANYNASDSFTYRVTDQDN